MRKKLLSLALILCMLVQIPMSLTTSAATPVKGTDGKYHITDGSELYSYLTYDPYGYFVLDQSITLSGTWTPVGTTTASTQFKGTLDGQGFSIKGLKVNGSDNAGLFGYTNGATIRDVTLADGYVTGGAYTGAVVGRAEGTLTLYKVYSSLNVSGTKTVGGLVGLNSTDARISDCGVSGTVTSTGAGNDTCYGGIIGKAVGTISSSYFTGTMSGSARTGGIVGDMVGTVKQCYSTGTINGKATVGGIAGNLESTSTKASEVSDSYSTGDVNGSSAIGGIVGNASAYSTGTTVIERCYSLGRAISTSSSAGGIAGTLASNKTYIKNCAALNNSVEINSATAAFGRITGYSSYSGGTKNYGSSAMIVKKNGVTQTISSDTYGKHGQDVSLSSMQNSDIQYKSLDWIFPSTWIMNPAVSQYPTLRSQKENDPKITLNYNEKSMYTGESFELIASPFPTDLATDWKVDIDSIVELSGSGNSRTVTALAEGTATIYVSAPGVAVPARCVVTVIKPYIELNITEWIFTGAEQKIELTATTYPAGLEIEWTNNNESVVDVTGSGNVREVKALEIGDAIITVSAPGAPGVKDAKCDIKCSWYESEIEGISIELEAGESCRLAGLMDGKRKSDQGEIAWSSSDSGVAAVDSTGKVTAVSEGRADITARDLFGNEKRITVFVEGVPATGVIVSPKSAEIKEYGTVALSAEVSPANATDKTVTWSSNDTSVAVVDENGIVTGISAGTATIIAKTANGHTDSSVITVLPLVSGDIAVWSTFANVGMAPTSGNGGIIWQGLTSVGTPGAQLNGYGWDNADDTNEKYWMVETSSTGFRDISVSFQQKSNLPAPKDFILQYRVGDGEWIDVDSYTIVKENNEYVNVDGNAISLSLDYQRFICQLPAAAENQSKLSIRWKCASTTAVNLQSIGPNALSFIQFIEIKGLH